MSSIAVIKQAMGWQPLNRRQACVNCGLVDERITVGISTWYCTSGQFLTNAMAICNRHIPRGQAAAAKTQPEPDNGQA